MTKREQIDGHVLSMHRDHLEQIRVYEDYFVTTDETIAKLEKVINFAMSEVVSTVYLLLKQELIFVRNQREAMKACYKATKEMIKMTEEYLKIRGYEVGQVTDLTEGK